MHFTGMLAFNLPISISYDLGLTLASILIAIFSAGCAFFYSTQKPIKLYRVYLGGIIMGGGVAIMHYSGMQAMRFTGLMFYKTGLLIASILIAISASTVALSLIIYFEEKDKTTNLIYKNIGALVMGLAVFGMHYTGMEATTFIFNGPIQHEFESSASVSIIIFSIFGIIILILFLAILASTTQGKFNNLKFVKVELEILVQERTKELKALSSFPAENVSPVFRVDSHNILLYSNSAGLSFLKPWGRKIGDEIPNPFIEFLNKAQPQEEFNKIEISQKSETFEFDIVKYLEQIILIFMGTI
jgi:NO-binding membrane sensor protein with MHYT domain